MADISAKKTSRSASLELLRFIAAVGIMIFHFGTQGIGVPDMAPYAFCFVEFFFILTGFFMLMYLETHENADDPFVYIKKRVNSFYSTFIIVLCYQLIIFLYTNSIKGIRAFFQTVFHFKWEFLLMHCSGVLYNPQYNKDYLLGHDWYLSALFLVLLIIYPIARYYRNFYKNILVPAATILLYPIIIQKFGTIQARPDYLGLTSAPVVRGMAGICTGSFTYVLYDKIKGMKFSPVSQKLLSVLDIALWLAMFYLLSPSRFFSNDRDILIYIVLFMIIVPLAVSDRTAVSGFLNHHFEKLFCYLGKMSMYLYITHWSVMITVKMLCAGMSHAVMAAIFFSATFAISIILMLMDHIRKTVLPVVIICTVLLGIAFYFCI